MLIFPHFFSRAALFARQGARVQVPGDPGGEGGPTQGRAQRRRVQEVLQGRKDRQRGQRRHRRRGWRGWRVRVRRLRRRPAQAPHGRFRLRQRAAAGQEVVAGVRAGGGQKNNSNVDCT